MKLEIGHRHPFEVRKERYMATNMGGFSMLYLSDLHLNGYGEYLVMDIIGKVNELNPTIILLGGDYVDTKNGLAHFATLMKAFSVRQNVFAIAGNHDRHFGIHYIKDMVTKNNAHWIEKDSFVFDWKGNRIRIDGNLPSANLGASEFAILCLHKPIDITQYAQRYHVAFAGHLHGCQAVFWQSQYGLYPGRFFYKWNILRRTFGKCQLHVSKGLGDSLPIRYNCKRDIIFIDVQKSL